MPTLSASILKRQLASVRDVEAALARQSMHGGDLATNLLELAAVSEAELTSALAESLTLEGASPGELPRAPAATLRLVPGELASRHSLYPLEERGSELLVAVAEPLPAEVEQDLAFSLGVRVVQRAALLVRVRQAIARDYRLTLDERTTRVLERLSGMRPSIPVASAVYAPELPRPASMPPLGFPARPPAIEGPHTERMLEQRRAPEPARAPEPTPTLAPPREHSPEAATALGRLAAPSVQRPSTRPRRLGPYTMAMAEKDLLAAETRDDILRAMFDFVCQYFEYSALFAVHDDLAEGREAHGPGVQRGRVNAIGVPLDLPSSLSSVRDSGSWTLARLTSSGIDASLAKDLERKAGPAVLLLPVSVRGRSVLILYGDHGDSDVELGKVGDVISFAPLVASALERVIMQRKRGGKGGTSLAPNARGSGQHTARRPPAVPIPSPVERATALAGVLELSPSMPPTIAASPEAVRRSSANMPRVEAPIQAPATLPPTTQPLPPQAPAPSPSRPSSPPPSSRDFVRPVIAIGGPQRTHKPTLAGLSDRPPPMESVVPTPSPKAPAPRLELAQEPPEDGWNVAEVPFPLSERGTRPGVGSGPTPAPAKEPRKDTPVLEPSTTGRLELVPDEEPVSGPNLSVEASALNDEEAMALEMEDGAPLAPPSRSVAYEARRPRPRYSSKELKLPSVIVNLENDCRELVQRLCEGDAEAERTLQGLGEPAVTALVAAFPGPITSDSPQSAARRASDCGPVLRTLARIGTSAVPFLVVRTADNEPATRAWATRLLGEMPTAEAGRAVARRLSDTNEDVRRAAIFAMRLMQHDLAARKALRDEITDFLLDPGKPPTSRSTVLEALADIRDAQAVPMFIRLLRDKSDEIIGAAHWALTVVTRQDFGREPRPWEAWWRENMERHRVEWLIDALMHENQDVRRAAAEELKSLTKEYFGYYDDLPKKERSQAQQRYREWWETRGKARFH
jgi:hypothetical protein